MAAMDFPSSPTNGQVANGYTYDSAKGAWRKNAAVTVSVTTSAVAPSNPNPGDQWLYTNEGTLFTWWSDGTSSQWVQSSSVIANADPNPMPAGSIMAWGGATAPQNWLLCDGSAVSRSTYASLFAAIGIQYGAGDGSTTFNLPNLKGRTIVGLDSSQTEFDALGETGGAKTHTLTSSEIPSHTHSFSATTSTTGSHNHINGWASITGYNYVGSGGNSTWPFGGGSNAAQRDLQAAGDHAHTVSGTTGTAGTGGAHNNLQPYIVLNYIIKASAGVTPGDSVLTTRVGTAELEIDALQLADSTTNKSGLVPIIPTSVSVNVGTASVDSGGTISFSGAGSLSINGAFTSLYSNYRVVITSYGSVLGIAEYLRFRSAGADRTGATYYYGGSMCREGGALSSWAGNGATVFDLTRTHTSEMTDTSIDIYSPAIATKPTSVSWLAWANDGSGGFGIYCAGTYNPTNANDGFTLWLSSGSFGGTVKIYGYR